MPAGDRQFTVAVAEPLDEMEESLQRFDRALFIFVPLLLLLASVGGWWMSTRALAPVDRITLEAARISIGNLSARVPVPATKDELHRLAQTLNEMLGRIETAVRRMTQFTADASHELRAPLTLIHTAADFSLRGERSREDLMEAMRKIARESMRTGSLVDNLLVLARADSGVDPIELREVDLVQIARKARDEMLLAAQAKRIDLTLKTPKEALRAHELGPQYLLVQASAHLIAEAGLEGSPGCRDDGEDVGDVDALMGMGADEGDGFRYHLVGAGEYPRRLALDHFLGRHGDARPLGRAARLEYRVEGRGGAEAYGFAVEHDAREAGRGELAEDVLVVHAEDGQGFGHS